MDGLTPEDIALVREHADLLEVASATIDLHCRGHKYQGACPFHGEKQPSFYVRPKLGIYSCQVCGEAGDVFQFVQMIEGVRFFDAVRILARRYKLRLSDGSGG